MDVKVRVATTKIFYYNIDCPTTLELHRHSYEIFECQNKENKYCVMTNRKYRNQKGIYLLSRSPR